MNTCILILKYRPFELVRVFFPSCSRRRSFLTGFRNERISPRTCNISGSSTSCLRYLCHCSVYMNSIFQVSAPSLPGPQHCPGPCCSTSSCTLFLLLSLQFCSCWQTLWMEDSQELSTVWDKSLWKLAFAKTQTATSTNLPLATLTLWWCIFLNV